MNADDDFDRNEDLDYDADDLAAEDEILERWLHKRKWSYR